MMNFKLPLAATLAAIMAVSSLGTTAASAAPAAKLPATHQQSAADDGQLIQVKAKKRVVRRNGNNAAAAAAFAGIAGAMIGLAAQESRRDRYYRSGYYYGDGPYYGGRRTYYRSQPQVRYYQGGGQPRAQYYRGQITTHPGVNYINPNGDYRGPALGNPALGQATTPANEASSR